MDKKLGWKLADEKILWAHIQELKDLIGGADRKTLALALEQKDLPALCKALKVKEEGLQSLLRRGFHEAENIALKHPELAKELKKKK